MIIMQLCGFVCSSCRLLSCLHAYHHASHYISTTYRWNLVCAPYQDRDLANETPRYYISVLPVILSQSASDHCYTPLLGRVSAPATHTLTSYTSAFIKQHQTYAHHPAYLLPVLVQFDGLGVR